MAAFGEFWGYKEYLSDAAFTWDAALLAKDSFKGYRYYKYLKMHFKSPAEIRLKSGANHLVIAMR